MKFRCEKDVLDRAFSIARRATPSKNPQLPVLSGLYLLLKKNQLTVIGSDLDLTVRIQIKVNGEQDGEFVVPPLASEIVHSFDEGTVAVDINDDEAQFSLDRSNFGIRTLPINDFPKFEEPGSDPVDLNINDFMTALDQVVKAASNDEARQILTGVLLAAEKEGLRMVATDSYRMAVRDLPGTEVLGRDQTVLVPSRALENVSRLLGSAEKFSIQLGERDAGFTVDDVKIVTRLIEGEFPNYRGLIPDSHPNRLLINKDNFLTVVQRVRLLARDSTPIRVKMTQNNVEVFAITQDIGEAHEEIEATYTGEDLTVAFNPEYLLQGLEVSPGEDIFLDTTDALKPVVIRGKETEEFLYMLMPVRVS